MFHPPSPNNFENWDRRVKPTLNYVSWINDLAHDVLEEILPIDSLAPVGCHHFFNDETSQHEVTLFASKTEILGGADDGRQQDSRFCLDLAGIWRLFENVVDFHWQTTRAHEDDDLGAHISIEGEYHGHSVWLRILAEAPQQFDHGRVFDINSASVKNLW